MLERIAEALIVDTPELFPTKKKQLKKLLGL
jgi:hypothetical protein